MTDCKGYERRVERCVLRQHSRMSLWGVRENIAIFSQKQSTSGTKVISPPEYSPPHCVFQLLPCLDLCNLHQHSVITLQLASGQQTGTPVPYKEVWVKRDVKYRLRLVGGLCTVCGVQFSIEGHDLTLIATDGTPVSPVTVRSILIFSGTNS